MNLTKTLGVASILATTLCTGTATAQGGSQNNAILTYIQTLPLETVDATEHFLLDHMRQEEKLARDVYLTLDQYWQMPVFHNIAQAEQSHMDLVWFVMQRYQLPDPLPNNHVGTFADPAFTQLYQLAVNVGQMSPAHALMVGAVIEDLDISDLQVALPHTDNRDIDTVWQNLARGSRNHMRAFYARLQNYGITYQGLFLTSTQIQAIVNSPRETRPVDENGTPIL